jgi:hypothetical protein
MLDAQFVENILQSLTAGVLIGAIYGLMCTGLALIFGVMRVINFAQGDFMMLGMYAAYYFFVALGVNALFGDIYAPYVAAFLAGPALFIVGYIIHKTLIARVSGTRTVQLEGEGHHAQLILTLGIALILQNAGQIAFGSMVVSVLSERRRQLAGTLSGGEQQMLAIGRGLAFAPKLLMLDEPSMGVAPAVVDFIFERFLDIRSRSRLTILLVEQRVAEALQFADHGYVLEAGRVVLQGGSEALRADHRIRAAYLGM